MHHHGGARYYGRTLPNDPTRFYLNLAPIYDPGASFSIGLALQETFPRPIQAFLLDCKEAKAPRSEYRLIEARFNTLLPQWKEKISFDFRYAGVMMEAGKRVAGGEDPEDVMKDVQAQFEAMYEASDSSESDNLGRPDES